MKPINESVIKCPHCHKEIDLQINPIMTGKQVDEIVNKLLIKTEHIK